jgi:hypothetical protein
MNGGLVIYVRKMNIFYLTLIYFFVKNVHKMNIYLVLRYKNGGHASYRQSFEILIRQENG